MYETIFQLALWYIVVISQGLSFVGGAEVLTARWRNKAPKAALLIIHIVTDGEQVRLYAQLKCCCGLGSETMWCPCRSCLWLSECDDSPRSRRDEISQFVLTCYPRSLVQQGTEPIPHTFPYNNFYGSPVQSDDISDCDRTCKLLWCVINPIRSQRLTLRNGQRKRHIWMEEAFMCCDAASLPLHSDCQSRGGPWWPSWQT